jgi:hypothetical protein
VPLVSTDRRFSRDASKDSAAYFTPGDAYSAASQIVHLAEDESYWQQKSDRGYEVFKDFPNAAEKWGLQKKVITHVAAL